ncbi:hypothetical protein PanWU01x14_291810 [Parasponia andersonii]|uniref:Uncharacterized protein n=1 Tax=Parasponia andersonii TaxID=3476 RepID=A0A2P5AX46_PARAD|nr:hypothetical protein PanWU01x14_291810 [Parasponia andersonii]
MGRLDSMYKRVLLFFFFFVGLIENGFCFFFNLPSSSSAAKNPGQDPGPNTASPREEPVGVRPGLSQSIFEGLNEEGHVSGRRNIQSQRDCRESRREKELQHRFQAN